MKWRVSFHVPAVRFTGSAAVSHVENVVKGNVYEAQWFRVGSAGQLVLFDGPDDNLVVICFAPGVWRTIAPEPEEAEAREDTRRAETA